MNLLKSSSNGIASSKNFRHSLTSVTMFWFSTTFAVKTVAVIFARATVKTAEKPKTLWIWSLSVSIVAVDKITNEIAKQDDEETIINSENFKLHNF